MGAADEPKLEFELVLTRPALAFDAQALLRVSGVGSQGLGWRGRSPGGVGGAGLGKALGRHSLACARAGSRGVWAGRRNALPPSLHWGGLHAGSLWTSISDCRGGWRGRPPAPLTPPFPPLGDLARRPVAATPSWRRGCTPTCCAATRPGWRPRRRRAAARCWRLWTGSGWSWRRARRARPSFSPLQRPARQARGASGAAALCAVLFVALPAPPGPTMGRLGSLVVLLGFLWPKCTLRLRRDVS